MNTLEKFRQMVAVAQQKMDEEYYRGGSDLIGEHYDPTSGPSLIQIYQALRRPGSSEMITVIVDYNIGRQEGIQTLIHEVKDTIQF